MKRISLILTISIFSCTHQNSSSNLQVSNTAASYKVTIQEDKKLALVEAEFSLENEVIYTYINFSKDLKNGSSDFHT